MKQSKKTKFEVFHLIPLRIRAVVPGLGLSILVTAAAAGLEYVERLAFGESWLESLVIAILLGAFIRSFWTPGRQWASGIAFSAKILLEIAVVMLGASISAGTILGAGGALLAGVVGVVGISLAASYGLGRMFGLPHRMATLIACGNSICGNSAIAAVAPVIDADSDDVAASIAFTAVLGVVVVLLLPVLAVALDMTPRAFGVFAGLTVYAVPQVLAATAPISSFSAQIGTLVKLVRVLMLGPVVLFLPLFTFARSDDRQSGDLLRRLPSAHHLVPWFIIGFLLMITARSFGLLPLVVVAPLSLAARWLTIVSMAALGLGVDVRHVAKAGLRVAAVVTLSLVALGGVAFLLIQALQLN
ncbi:MAG: putative sulfate exporter family transporter [Beijerinckiaceae bacterium]|jgi:uncharacterized integral membrane protein (TIGR00698 family)